MLIKAFAIWPNKGQAKLAIAGSNLTGVDNWDATVTTGRLDDDTTVAERVSFDKAKVAIEQYAQQHADRV